MWKSARKPREPAERPPDPESGVVTAIAESPRRPGRYTVSLDGVVFGAMTVDGLVTHQLGVGTALDADGIRALRQAVDSTAVYDRACDLLAVRSRSARELEQRLRRTGVEDVHIDSAIARLLELGLLNDETYARQVARAKLTGAGASRRRIQQELFKRGVARDVADEAIAETFRDEVVDETQIVEGVARKKLRSLGGLDDDTRRRRLYAFLARRGYDGEAIRKALRVVLSESGDSDEEQGLGTDEESEP